jgi:hypothetical protein
MSLIDLAPPLGWLTAFSSAVITALWLQGGHDVEVSTSPEKSMLVQDAADAAESLRSPPRSDAARATELFVSRPLLAEGRRPFVPEPIAEAPEVEPPPPVEEPQAASAVAPEPPPVVMLGTVEIHNARRVLLRDELSGTETWYSSGDNVLGWTIVDILPEQTLLQLEDAEITFNLFGE